MEGKFTKESDREYVIRLAAEVLRLRQELALAERKLIGFLTDEEAR